MRPFVVVHRLPASAAGIEACHRAGATTFELDLQLVDGVVGVSHMLPLVRGVGAVRHEGAKVRLYRRFAASTLAEVLVRLPAGATLALDLKNDREPAASRLVAAVLAGLDPSAGPQAARLRARVVGIGSHHWPSLVRLRGAGLPTWLTVGDRRALARLAQVDPAGGHAGVSVRHTLLTSQVLAGLRPHGRVVAWTVGTVRRASELVGLGVDAVTTDSVEVMRVLAGPAGGGSSGAAARQG